MLGGPLARVEGPGDPGLGQAIARRRLMAPSAGPPQLATGSSSWNVISWVPVVEDGNWPARRGTRGRAGRGDVSHVSGTVPRRQVTDPGPTRMREGLPVRGDGALVDAGSRCRSTRPTRTSARAGSWPVQRGSRDRGGAVGRLVGDAGATDVHLGGRHRVVRRGLHVMLTAWPSTSWSVGVAVMTTGRASSVPALVAGAEVSRRPPAPARARPGPAGPATGAGGAWIGGEDPRTWPGRSASAVVAGDVDDRVGRRRAG